MESDEKRTGDENKCAISTLDHTKNSLVTKEGTNQLSEWREKPYRCCICRAEFHTKTDIADHMLTHPTCAKKHFICSICINCSLSTQALSRHLSLYHACCDSIATCFERKPVFRCDTCPYIGTTFLTVQQHRMKHQGTYKFQCSYCKKQFRQKYELVIHERNHTGEKPFSCDRCGLSFSNPSNARMHREACGDDVMKKHVCNVCGKGFKTAFSLYLHKPTHNEHRPYKCAHCNWRCKRKSDLKIHMRTHTKEKRYICHVCSKAFSVSTNRNWHIRRHHGIDRVDQSVHRNKNPKDKYHCMDCEETFRLKVQLETHMKEQHKNETSRDKDSESSLCFQCGKVFKTESALEAHLKNRHKVRTAMPYKCVFCMERFSYKLELLEHLKVHENEDGEIQPQISDVEINKAHANTTDETENTTRESDVRPKMLDSPDLTNMAQVTDNTTKASEVVTHESPLLLNTEANSDNDSGESVGNTPDPTIKQKPLYIFGHNTPLRIFLGPHKTAPLDENSDNITHETVIAPTGDDVDPTHETVHVIAPREDPDHVTHESLHVIAPREDLDYVTHESLHVIAPQEDPDYVTHESLHVIAPQEDPDYVTHESLHVIAPLGERSDVLHETLHVIAPVITDETDHVIVPISEEMDRVKNETVHVIAPIGEEMDHVKNETIHVISPTSKESDLAAGINSPSADLEKQGVDYSASSRMHKIILINPHDGQRFVINTPITQDMQRIVFKAPHRGISMVLNVPLKAAGTTVVTLP